MADIPPRTTAYIPKKLLKRGMPKPTFKKKGKKK
jgi:hypothetical protein